SYRPHPHRHSPSFPTRRSSDLLVDGALRQADIVRKAVADADIDVASVLCFVGADWPLLGGDFHIRNAYVTWPKKLASRINRPGRSEEHTSELQSRFDLVCRLLL